MDQQSLAPKDQVIWILWQAGKSPQEIADAIKWNHTSVKVAISRIKNKLKINLKRD